MSLSIIRGGAVGVSSVVESLTQALSETKIATSKAQTYHWNVTGMSFGPLHALFQDVYEDHFAAQDAIAERIRALGGHVDGRPSVALSGSAIRECDGRIDAEAMVKRLARDERTLSDTLRNAANAAEEAGDIASHDLAVERVAVHDKFAWILEAHLIR